MRRPRQRLQVSTFPFLAVLLGAMGALILVLLVMDRRAKQVARAKLRQETIQVETEEERRLAEQERRRLELRAQWLLEKQHLEGQVQAVHDQGVAAGVEAKSGDDRRHLLLKQIEFARTELALREKQLSARHNLQAQTTEANERAQKEINRLHTELLLLEQLAAEIKAARQQARQTFSVIPYRGTRGDSRRPIYIECAASGVIFHPERTKVDGPAPSRVDIRLEVEKRIAALRSSGDKKEENAYLLMLIRPNGVLNYYLTLEALKGVSCAFGYELIDTDWALDFPNDEGAFQSPSWMMAGARGAPGVASTTAPGTREGGPPRGVAFGNGAQGGNEPAGGVSRGSGRNPGNVEMVNDRPGPGVPGSVGIGTGGGNHSNSGTKPGGASISPQAGNGNSREPGGILAQGGTGPQQGAPASQGNPPTVSGNRANPAQGLVGQGGNPTQGGTAASGAGQAGQAGESKTGEPRNEPEAGGSSGGGGARTGPQPVRLGGGRDWIIQVECISDAVIVHPTRLRISASNLKPPRGAENSLLQTVQQMIQRRQTSVRPGELPYRPQVRFLVRPDGLRTFHQAYPLLESLRLPMTRLDLALGEDIRDP